jgi:ankyrin repeat protein
LLGCGANVDAQNKDGKTVLHFAVEGDEKFIKLLLECGANIDAQDKGVLHFAVKKGDGKLKQLLEGYPELVNILSKLCAGIVSKDEYGSTPLHIAAKKCHQDEGGKTVLHFVVDKGDEKVKLLLESHVEIFEILSKFYAGIDSKDEYGSTPLHIVA